MQAPPISPAVCLFLINYWCTTVAPMQSLTKHLQGGEVGFLLADVCNKRGVGSCPVPRKKNSSWPRGPEVFPTYQLFWSTSLLPRVRLIPREESRGLPEEPSPSRCCCRGASCSHSAMPRSFPQQPLSASSHWSLWWLCWCFSVQESFGPHNVCYRNCGYLL